MGLNIIKLLHPRQFRSATMKLKLVCIVVLLQLPTWLLPCHAEDERDMRYWKFSEEGYVPEISDRLKHRKHWGFINRAGEFVIAPQYDLVRAFDGETTYVIQNEKGWPIDKLGKALAAPKPRFDIYGEINKKRWAKESEEKLKENATKFKGKIFDRTGTEPIVDAASVELSGFSEGLASCCLPENLISEIRTGPLEPAGLLSPHGYTESILPADRRLNHCGYINQQGRMVIPPHFYQTHEFKDGVASVDIWNSALQPNAQKSGYIDREGRLIGGKTFDTAWEFENGFGIISKKKKDGPGDEWGFIDKSGRQLFSDYIEVLKFAEGIAAVKDKDGKWGFINDVGRMVVKPQFDLVDYRVGAGLFCVERDGRFGYMDKSGTLTIPCKFADGGVFSDGMAAAAIDAPESEKLSLLQENIDEHCGFIARSGQQVIAPKFIGARHFSEGLCAVEEGLYWGFIDVNGKEVISAKFDEAQSFSEGLAAVRKDDQWGFIDKTGTYIIPPRFPAWDRSDERIRPPKGFSDGFAQVCFPDGDWHFINREGREAFKMHCAGGPRNFNIAKSFSEGLAVMDDKNFENAGYVDKGGRLQIGHKFTEAEPFSEGLAAVYYSPKPMATGQVPMPFTFPSKPADVIPEKWGYIDRAGKFVIAPRYDRVGPFKDGVARVGNRINASLSAGGDKGLPERLAWQFINRVGRQLNSMEFDDARDFSEGRASVCVGQKWGFIDRTGKFAVSPKFEAALDFYEGLAAVKVDGKWGFINTAGKMEIPPRYWRCGSFKDGRALIVTPGNARPPSTNANWLNQEMDFGKFWQLDQRGPNAWGWEGHH